MKLSSEQLKNLKDNFGDETTDALLLDMENYLDTIEALQAELGAAKAQLSEEQQAHQKIAEICFKAGARDSDGTSVSAVRNLAAKLADLEGIDKVADFAHENIKNMQENIDALQDELASARETIEVLSDNALVKGIAQGVKDVEAGNTIKLEDLEENLLVAGAYLAAAELIEQLNREGPYQAIGAAKHIKALTPADAERSLQVYVAERIKKYAEYLEGMFVEMENVPDFVIEALTKELAAATARLAELRNTKA